VANASGAIPTNEDGLPRRFGKYTLLRVLAKGGMAELFLAIQKSVAGFEKLIVIKRILPSMNQDKAFIEMLLHEARIAATLSHNNIVQIFDVGQAEGLYFIAMEHVHGEDIRSIVRGMRVKGVPEFPLEHALAITMGMCAGLSYAHEKRDLDGSELNIVHRDISPQNVVITFSGDVKIVDFGIAKSDTKMHTETKSGKLKGKVPYMSPEQARGEAIDARSDIFATGVMLFELTTGKRLFKGSSEFETLKLICEREYPRPSQVRPGYPEELERIVMKSLMKDKNERYQSTREMQSDVEAFARNNRIAVSNIALSQFMQGLFQDKLQSQKEELLQGKQLADIIEQQNPTENIDTSQALSTPAATHTLPGTGRGRGGMAVGAVAALILIAGGIGSTVYVMKQKQQRALQAQTTTQQAAVAKGKIEITTDPPGAAIWIDGDMRPDVTPATIAQLPTSLGHAIDVRISKEGFESYKQAVSLTDSAPKSSINISLKKGSVVIDVAVVPAGLKPTLALDGKKYDAVSTIDGIASGDQHKLVVSSPGYVDYETKFIGQPQENKHFDVTLVKAVAATNTGGGHTVDVAPRGSGKLNVGASGGWCNVSVDGAGKGPTPLAGIELASGPHRVTCTTGEGKTQSTMVNVPIDGTARYKFTL
jgi:serine/threonine-protein kinase